ncbi:MAG: hypothetical protein [Siphoviridae sp. ctjeG17]|nr:MAG: hypothetical protein [Siphoviridae sp. ctjeG17]
MPIKIIDVKVWGLCRNHDKNREYVHVKEEDISCFMCNL